VSSLHPVSPHDTLPVASVAAAGSALNPALLARIAEMVARVQGEVAKVFIGTPDLVEHLLCALVAGGHVLLEGVPGVAKTTLVKTFARTLGCSFRRIQFTPDLLPSDITGTYVLQMQQGTFTLREGPIFANIVLGDEINRAPAKTQSALLEAMQEGQVTIEGHTRPLEPPFLVLATQNPVEQEGTYPLPEAQIDRFLIKLAMRYPAAELERQLLETYNRPLPEVAAVLSPTDILGLCELGTQVHLDAELMDFIVALVRHTREHRRVQLGCSPRASLMLMRAAKALALLRGRDFVIPDDIKGLAQPVLAHRLVLQAEAELDGFAAAQVIAEAVDKTAHLATRRAR
jgi:MoxR-like ATPase